MISNWASGKSVNGYLFAQLMDENNNFADKKVYEIDQYKIAYAELNTFNKTNPT